MSEAAKILRKNLEKEEKALLCAKAVRDAQILEAALYLKERNMTSFEDIGSFFQKSFSRPAVSGELLSLVTHLSDEETKEKPKSREHATVALIMSPVSRLALEKLTDDVRNVRPFSFSDFRSACEAVSSDRCDYCILPFCSSADGYYPTFSKLVKSYELKICRTARISRTDSDEEILWALLSKSLEKRHGAVHVAFSLVESDGFTVSDVITALRDGGCRLLSVNSSPLEYNMDRSEYRLEVQTEKTTPCALCTFLSIALPGHTVLGIY